METPSISKNIIQLKDAEKPLISVIIPTRNEAGEIEKCIRSLKAQSYPNLEVIIVDDSTDDTVKVIKRSIGKDKRFKIIKQGELPSDWIGKTHALQQGSRLASGRWLLFIDADTVHHPQLILGAVEHALKNNLDMLSLSPHLSCRSFWEKIIQPIPAGMLVFLSPLAKANDPESPVAFAAGPFILIKHSVFKEIDGFEKIKDKIGDDVELATLVKEAGNKLGVATAHDMIKVRMYDSFNEIWEGWSKNIFLGLMQKRDIGSRVVQSLIALVGLIGIFVTMVLPFVSVIITLGFNVFDGNMMGFYAFFLSGVTWLFSVFVQSTTSKLYSIGDPKYAPLYFMGGLMTMGMFLNSAIKTILGSGVLWKGRVYFDQETKSAERKGY